MQKEIKRTKTQAIASFLSEDVHELPQLLFTREFRNKLLDESIEKLGNEGNRFVEFIGQHIDEGHSYDTFRWKELAILEVAIACGGSLAFTQELPAALRTVALKRAAIEIGNRIEELTEQLEEQKQTLRGDLEMAPRLTRAILRSGVIPGYSHLSDRMHGGWRAETGFQRNGESYHWEIDSRRMGKTEIKLTGGSPDVSVHFFSSLPEAGAEQLLGTVHAGMRRAGRELIGIHDLARIMGDHGAPFDGSALPRGTLLRWHGPAERGPAFGIGWYRPSSPMDFQGDEMVGFDGRSYPINEEGHQITLM